MKRKSINHAWVLRRYDGAFSAHYEVGRPWNYCSVRLANARFFATREAAREHARSRFARGQYRIRRVELVK